MCITSYPLFVSPFSKVLCQVRGTYLKIENFTAIAPARLMRLPGFYYLTTCHPFTAHDEQLMFLAMTLECPQTPRGKQCTYDGNFSKISTECNQGMTYTAIAANISDVRLFVMTLTTAAKKTVKTAIIGTLILIEAKNIKS